MSSTTSAPLVDLLLLLHHQTCRFHCLLLFDDKSSFSELCEVLGILVPKSFPISAKERLYELNNKCAVNSLSLSRPPALSAMHLDKICALGLFFPSSLDTSRAVTDNAVSPCYAYNSIHALLCLSVTQ